LNLDIKSEIKQFFNVFTTVDFVNRLTTAEEVKTIDDLLNRVIETMEQNL